MVFTLIAISTVILLAALYKALPESMEVYHRFTRDHMVECPDNNQQSTVAISPVVAAGTSAIVGTVLVIKECTRWPEHRRCRRDCKAQLRYGEL